MKTGAAIPGSVVLLEQSAHHLKVSSVRKAFLSSFKQTSQARLFYGALCLDVIVPEEAAMAIKIIVIHFGLKDSIPVKITGHSLSGRSRDWRWSLHVL